MKKIIKYFSIIVVLFLMLTINAKAESKNTYVNLESLEFSTNNKDYKSITEYKTLEEFLSDYNSNKLPSIYITDFLYDGVGTVKAPDLDDFIEKDSNDTRPALRRGAGGEGASQLGCGLCNDEYHLCRLDSTECGLHDRTDDWRSRHHDVLLRRREPHVH